MKIIHAVTIGVILALVMLWLVPLEAVAKVHGHGFSGHSFDLTRHFHLTRHHRVFVPWPLYGDYVAVPPYASDYNNTVPYASPPQSAVNAPEPPRTFGCNHQKRLERAKLRSCVVRKSINLCSGVGGNGEDVMTAQNEPKLIFPRLAGLYQRFSPFSYAFMRFATGAVLLPHGIQKVLFVPIAKFAPNIATYFAESAAAACLAIGLFTRIAAAIIGIEMLVIIFLFQWQFGYFWTVRGYEYALLWLLLCIAIFFRGGGRYSIDHIIGKEF